MCVVILFLVSQQSLDNNFNSIDITCLTVLANHSNVPGSAYFHMRGAIFTGFHYTRED